MATDETVRQVAESLEDALGEPQSAVSDPLTHIGVHLSDPAQRRLLAGIAIQLDLMLEPVTNETLVSGDLSRFGAIIADPHVADRLHVRLTETQKRLDDVQPVVIKLGVGERLEDLLPHMRPTDGIIELPKEPTQLLAQLSVVLYAQRSFVQRYQSALEELHLNRRIFRSVTSGISVASATQPDFPLTYVNPAFEVMTGYSLEQVQGQNCRFLQGQDREQQALVAVREALSNFRQVTVVLRNYRKDGSCFWNELSLAPIRNREGQVTHFVGIQNDVTARVEFEAALRESEKLAAVGRLAASIAHEINNPLESVMNLLYLAAHEETLEGTKGYVREAEVEVKRIALVTTQSLRFYRQNTQAQAVDCDELLSEVLDLYMPKLVRFQVEVQHDRAVHDHVICMDSEIRQVLSNLVRNAIDAMRVRGGRLVARTRLMTEHRTGKRGVAITLADTGTGIAPEVMQRLYTAFFTTKGDVGTGLGLWVSANIVERHQGRLMVRSKVGVGTVFTLFLPFSL